MSHIEILNIAYHTRDLLLRALNKYPVKTKACKALSVSERTMYNMIEKFEVKQDLSGKYYSNKVIEFKK
jgi:hypothetical protein